MQMCERKIREEMFRCQVSGALNPRLYTSLGSTEWLAKICIIEHVGQTCVPEFLSIIIGEPVHANFQRRFHQGIAYSDFALDGWNVGGYT